MDARDEPDDGAFTALDWIAVVLVVGLAGWLITFPWARGRVFAAMYRDFALTMPLPVLTRLTLSTWFAPSLALAPLVALVAGALAKRRTLGVRRALVVGAFALACGGVALCLWGAYQPVHEIADAVRAE